MPTFGWNPSLSRHEVAWSRHDGSDYEIVLSYWSGDQWSSFESLTANGSDDKHPSLAFAPDGTLHLAYERDGSIHYRERDPAGAWQVEETIGPGNHPDVARSNEVTLVYQRDAGSLREIVAATKPAGWSLDIVSTTDFDGFAADGDLDVRVRARSGRFSVIWENGPLELGWSQKTPTSGWSAISTVTTPSANDHLEERERMLVRNQVLR